MPKRILICSELSPAELREQAFAADTPREGKRVGTFSETVTEVFGDKTREFRRIVRVTVREIDKHGQRLLVPEIALEGWWTSFGEGIVSDETVIALYCAHATSEHFHAEFKTDLDIERLPSGKFATNDLVLTCAMLAYNTAATKVNAKHLLISAIVPT